jgi:hypothetical protein
MPTPPKPASSSGAKPVVSLGSHWRGKKLLVDFDDTLVQCSRAFEPPDERGWGSRGPQIPMEGDLVYEVVRVNADAVEALAAARDAGAMPIVTSAAAALYVERAAAAVGLAPVLYGVFGQEHLRYTDGAGLQRCAPKNYEPVIEALGVRDPLASCVVIGNDPTGDIPIAPLGVVTVLVTIDARFHDILATLDHLLTLGEGSFARGFDALIGGGSLHHGPAEFEDVLDWKFLEKRAGRARLIYLDRDAVEQASGASLWL